MTYTPGGEVMLTASQMRAVSRLLAILSAEQLEKLAGAMEDVIANGQGMVTVKIYRGHPRFIEPAFTYDLRE